MVVQLVRKFPDFIELEVRGCFHNSSLMDPILGVLNPVSTLSILLTLPPNNQCHIIVTSMPNSPNLFQSFEYKTHNFLHTHYV